MAADGGMAFRGVKVIVSGKSERLLYKLEVFLKSLGAEVSRYANEQETVQQAVDKNAALVLAEFCENPENFDARKVYAGLQADSKTQSTNFLTFHFTEGLGLDLFFPPEPIPRSKVIYYQESYDLGERVRDYMETHGLDVTTLGSKQQVQQTVSGSDKKKAEVSTLIGSLLILGAVALIVAMIL